MQRLEARSYFKHKVYQTVIPRNIRLSEAPGFGKPIALYDRTSIGAQKYLELCREILGPQFPENIDFSTMLDQAKEPKEEPNAEEGIGQGITSLNAGEAS